MSTGRGPLENDTVRDVILPRLRESGWSDGQIREQYYLRAQTVTSTGGITRDLGKGFADLVLEATPGTPVAVVEAKREYRSAEIAIQQAIRYAQQLDAPLAYGSNGSVIIERNLRTGTERIVDTFADPALAWEEYALHHDLDRNGVDLVAEPFNRRRQTVTGDVIEPRPYQVVAINRTLTAIARGAQRVLLLMATGTGKTFTAMQIVAKLRAHDRRVRPNHNYRVLYLADRSALLEQPIRNDFQPAFGNEAIRRVLGGTDKSREIYFATYQSLTNEFSEDGAKLLEYGRDFFDLVIVDECHRGSADENSKWRAVLDHFSSAIHLGLTATPRDDTVNSYDYFGAPVFTYSLREGIDDGYLAKYRVRRVVLSPDAYGWEPTAGQVDRFGRDIPEGLYGTRDFERVVSLLERTRLAAGHLSGILRTHPSPRAIVFCVDVEHAAEMRRALIAENPDAVSSDPSWVVRIVGEEADKDDLLETFCDATGVSPAVATTSRLLSTGIDVVDLTHVVLFRPIGSMIEFKQIIGRGSRLHPDKGKTSFDIVDYVGASAKFEDPGFDGYPATTTIETVDLRGNVVDRTGDDEPDGSGDVDSTGIQVSEPIPPFAVSARPDVDAPAPLRKLYVDSGDFGIESDTLLVPDRSSGRLELTDFGAFVRERLRLVGDAEELRRQWTHADSRAKLKQMLETEQISLEEIVAQVGGTDVDPLDALHFVAWNLPTRTRAERAKHARSTHAAELERLSAQARAILEGLLQRYETYGVEELEHTEVFTLDPLASLGSVTELASAMGGADELRAQLEVVQEWLYSA